MAFYFVLIVAAVALLQVDARSISRRQEDRYPMVGGYHTIDASSIPPEVKNHAQETLISQFNSDKGIRLFEISEAEVQVVSGSNYKFKLLFHETECPATASSEEINDLEACPVTEYISCTVTVYHQSWTNTLKVTDTSCVR